MSSEPTPNDPAFRRGLFAMLLAIGVLIGGVLIDSRADAAAARRDYEALEIQYKALQENQRNLLQNQREILAVNKQTEARADRFEEFIGRLLANSSDPVVARSAADLGIEPSTPEDIARETRQPAAPRAPRATAAPRATTRATPAPRPTVIPRPTPQPTVAPRPTTLPRLPLPTSLPRVCTSILCVQP